ncbi:MAG: SAM-dependent methyltransferase [bacterium]|nr:MAG: SAM-dependent methyltransferase [bacterium]
MLKSDSDIKKDQLEVLSIAEGFFQSSILFALLKLKIFECIGEESKTLDELAAVLDTRPETLARLLNAGVVLKLLESTDGLNYRVASAGRSVLLPSAGENYLGNWILNLDYFRFALSKLDEAILKSEPVVDPSTHLGVDEDHTREFTLAMHNYASLRGKELARFLDTTRSKTLLDLGCGPGTYAFHLGMHNPNLQLYLLDLPGVLEVAKEVRTRYPNKNEVYYLPLDAVKDEIPGSYDIILVSNTLHMLGEQASRNLTKRLYRSINPGGSLVIQAQYMQDNRLGGRWSILLDLIQLCITSEGRNHSIGETRCWLEEAGFRDIEFCPMTLLNTNSFLRGYKT